MVTRHLKRHSFVTALLLLFFVSTALAETWSRQYIRSLPDSAFAVIEVTKDGTKIRHLPHHQHNGKVDISHVKSALSRVYQVKWVDPANFARAKEHLEQHYQEYKEGQAKARGD
ncbi:MAG TPA: hypothetical protein VKF36_11235 [Syntrophorhabdales bacterium]|nr:hypothetical protein [Syntrophorhabdales bacterium]